MDDGIDWRELLKAYMDHVIAYEGISFLTKDSGILLPDEVELLEKIEAELEAEEMASRRQEGDR